MLNRSEPACLVIADITGYTSYLAGVELDHAQDILADLMNTVVGSLRPTFRLAKLEGDAAFTFALTPTIDGSALMDTIERTYFAFRRRLRDIGQASVCDCNACIRMPAPRPQVPGPPRDDPPAEDGRPRRARREPGHRRPPAAQERRDRGDRVPRLRPVHRGLPPGGRDRGSRLRSASIEHREEYDHLGEVTGWVADLEAAWAAEQARTRVFVEPKAAMVSIDYTLPAPPAIAWDYLTSPARRLRWQAGVTDIVEEAAAGGRRGVGTTNHCVHGKDAVVEEILDWRPTEYFTLNWQMPIPGRPRSRRPTT